MKRKKYLACCLAMSMMLVSASPMAVSAEAQDDMFYSEDLGVEEAGDSESEEVVEPEAADSMDDGFTSEETEEIENFDSDVETYEGEGETAGAEAGWTQSEQVEGLSYKYDSKNQTFYMKSSTPVALPDYRQSGWTSEWHNKYGSELNNVKTIEIQGEITQIGKFNFDNGRKGAYDNLETVVLSSSVTKISTAAFGDVTTLKSINLNNVEELENAAFSGSGVENITFDKENVKIGPYAFQGCTSLISVTAKSIQSLGAATFNGCTALTTFKCETPLTKIPEDCFQQTAIESFNFYDISEIGTNAFNDSSLKYACYTGTKDAWLEMVGEPSWLGATIPEETIVHCKADTVEAKAATCTEDGWKEVGVCEVCGEHYSYPTEENKLTATGHAWKEDYDVDKEPTCTEAGSKSRHCENKGCSEKTDVQEIKALGHDYVSKVTKEATCTEKGTLTKTCSRCNDVVTEEIKALGHDFAKTYTVDKKATCTEAGEQSKHCTRKGCDAKDDVQAIPATGHKFGEWKVTAEATVFAAEQQERICETCGEKETKAVGTALKATASVNASTVKLKAKQSTSGLKVTGLAKGDSVKTWKSTNTKIFTVKGKANGTCKLTAKKAGTAKLQITLASGLKKTVKVKVQKAAVKTTKVTVAKTKVTVKKGKKVTLKPVVTPFTSKQKVTYTSSNKKVATVSSKGVVTGKKKGTAKITIKSGSKSVKVTVKVK